MSVQFFAFKGFDGRPFLVNPERIAIVIPAEVAEGDPGKTEIHVDGSEYPVLVDLPYNEVIERIAEWTKEDE